MVEGVCVRKQRLAIYLHFSKLGVRVIYSTGSTIFVPSDTRDFDAGIFTIIRIKNEV